MKKVFILFSILVVLVFLLSCSTKTESTIIERNGAITLDSKPLTLLGPELQIEQKAPDFSLLRPYETVEESFDTEEIKLTDTSGKIRVISVVPSLDTPVCDYSTRLFEKEASKFEDIVFYTISMDLPFAQSRYCGAQEIDNLMTLSDHRDGSFGLAYGVLIKELRLLSRAIFIINKDDTLGYIEYVKEISEPPDFDAALTALQKISEGSYTSLGSQAEYITEGSEVGQIAPDFQLENLKGEIVSLADFANKPLMINFWATWCPHCREERPKIQKLYEEWTAKGVGVITILIGTSKEDEPNNILELMQSNGYSFPVLLDLDFSVTESYGITETPTNFFIDSEGVIKEIRVGASDTKEDMDAIFEDLLK